MSPIGFTQFLTREWQKKSLWNKSLELESIYSQGKKIHKGLFTELQTRQILGHLGNREKGAPKNKTQLRVG